MEITDKINFYLNEKTGKDFKSSKEVAEYILKMEMAVKSNSKKKFNDRLGAAMSKADPSGDMATYDVIVKMSLNDAKKLYNQLNGYSFDKIE